MNLKQMLEVMLQKKASDLHLRVGLKPILRIDGALNAIETNVLTNEDIEQTLNQILNEDQKGRFIKRNEMDLALSVSKLGRFRINFYRQRGTIGIAIRAVNTKIPSFEELNLPPVIKTLSEQKRGLILVTGTTGSGKSTTLAAMIEHINQTRAENILTIEDPIEFVYRDKKSIISQREIGGDTESFALALRHAFRQDPDVILIGEVRDLDTMSIALTAADTGHLVLSTLHTMNAIETISRIITFFPPHQHQQIRSLLAGTLKAIICQRLLPRSDGPGRVPAVEVLVSSGSVREYITDPMKTLLLIELIESGAIQYGMQSFDQSIMKLYKSNMITYAEALAQTTSPDDFDLRVKGITGASDKGWQEFERSSSQDKK
ncbi:MAG TPA: type IV pilus twitching motility protein PilT [candidate division Zixibacteria bacterium]|nr:type IV pilus twitching motility protein PilT [candidate division Zixibacteria bacterium]